MIQRMEHALTAIGTFIIVGILFWFAAKRKRPKHPQRKVRRRISMTVPLKSPIMAARLAQQMKDGGYTVDEIAPDNSFVLLSDGASATSWGFYYPIYLSPEGSHQTQVEVGIQSKVIQMGPVVTKHHRCCVDMVKKILNVMA